jgi:formate dehydrogenase accessory protein FdhE
VAAEFVRKLLGRHKAVPRHVEEALAELARLTEQRPDLAELRRELGELLLALHAEPIRVEPLAISPEAAAAKLEAGVPLLRGETIIIEQPALDKCLERLVKVLKQRRPDAAKSLAAALRQQTLDSGALVAEVLAGRPQAVHERAEMLGLDVPLTASLFALALSSVLVPIGAALESRWRTPSWMHGYCPVCGSWPKLGEFRGLEQTRWLRCGLCAAEWEVPRVRCFYCGTRDHRQLGYLHLEGEENRYRAATCQECRHYVKMVSTLFALTPPLILVADLATVHLDLLAVEQGFSQPM